MNRPFWLFHSASSEDICNGVEPLLSAYADGMASPAEIRRIETHLPTCENCRIALAWTRATRTALAARPIAVPPPNLHSRIALAIAASSSVPVTLRPARVFSLRIIYAAAASVTALGIALSYPLWHTPTEVAVNHPAKPTVLATVPPITVKPPFAPKAPAQFLVASNSAKPAVKHSVLARKKALLTAAPLEHVAVNAVPAERPVALPSVTLKAPVHHAPVTQKIASRSIVPAETHGIEKHSPLPTAEAVTPKLPEGPKVAKVIKEPNKLRLDIPPIKVMPDPIRQTASAREAVSLRSNTYLSVVVAHIESMKKVTPAEISVPAQLSYHEATHVIQEVGNTDQTAFISAVHGNQ